ncbi:MAG: methyltransferase domain-containing protein [Crocinitomicaceae bacterium]|nr:methyltransferase domain-containing protein [Crocinitomicaceae bacterium]
MEELSAEFWNTCYLQNKIGWDLGEVSPALKYWMDELSDTSSRILIPGAGYAYEVDYLIQKGFQDITVVDIAPKLVSELKKRFDKFKQVTIILGDFFELTGSFDIILEQTFFCALAPSLRSTYVTKMASLLTPNGRLLGVLFNRDFNGGPPFGGATEEYIDLFQQAFEVTFFPCQVSYPARKGSEVLFEAKLILAESNKS